MPRTVSKKGAKERHDPLHVDMDADAHLAKYGRVSKPGKRSKANAEENENVEVGQSHSRFGYYRLTTFIASLGFTYIEKDL